MTTSPNGRLATNHETKILLVLPVLFYKDAFCFVVGLMSKIDTRGSAVDHKTHDGKFFLLLVSKTLKTKV